MYSNERVAQLVVALLKMHGVRKIIASPGNTNFGVVGSMQQDSFFQMYSSVDERSAAYMACGLAASSGEPVALTCTGATASREYLAGLTEAYYRKLPVIALTSFNGTYNVGQLMPQNIDRRVSQNDVKVYSVDLPAPKDGEDERYCVRKINEALLASKRHGGGPVHINIPCDYKNGFFETKELPRPRKYSRHMPNDTLPSMDSYNKIAVFIGAHVPFTNDERNALESFVLSRNAVVLTDHTSNYTGQRSILAPLTAENSGKWSSVFQDLAPDLIIDLGEVSGDYVTTGFLSATKCPVWRVSSDGELRDRFNGLRRVFEMGSKEFFDTYTKAGTGASSYYDAWMSRKTEIESKFPTLPFTNRWIASYLAPKLPAHSVLHLAILNSLRSWNYYDVDPNIVRFSNTGGFGIDGCLSTAIGSALADSSKMNYVFMGDLAFFYDMNSLGNRYLPKNLRVLVVNNGIGVEFHMPYSPAAVMGADVDAFVAAAGHFRKRFGDESGDMSPIRAWCEALGITYMRAQNKGELQAVADDFVTGEHNCPIVLECIVDPKDEVRATGLIGSIDEENARKQEMAKKASSILPRSVKDVIKRAIG